MKRIILILASLGWALACGQTSHSTASARGDESSPEAGSGGDATGGAGAGSSIPRPCETNSDCFCERCHCCGCTTSYVCEDGTCVEGPVLCSDAHCCFTNFGCGSSCEILTPYPDYDGSCAGVDCGAFNPYPEGLHWQEYVDHGCCTTGEPGVSSAADRCGVDVTVVASQAAPGSCVELERAGTLDPSCPDGDPDPATSEPMPGCCTPEGYCGVMMTRSGLGCAYVGFSPSSVPCGNSAVAGAGGGSP